MPTPNYCNTNHILIGLGGTGGRILREFKMRMFEEFPDPDMRKRLPVSLLYVDSTKEMIPKDGRPRANFRMMGQDASFTYEEFLFIGNGDEATRQKRHVGRQFFASNAIAFVNALRNAYVRCEKISGNSHLNIHIFAGLAGGTGSGSIIDAIVQTRKSFPDAFINVYAMIPERHLPNLNMDTGYYYANGYAALNELNALQVGRYKPIDITGTGEPADVWSERINGVANAITLYSNTNENGLELNSFQELPKAVSDYVFSFVFLLNPQNDVCEDFIRRYKFESEYTVEYDELADMADENQWRSIARTKKVNTFGVKRVMYPELLVLKHITYTIGKSALLQFMFNNWCEGVGYIDEEVGKALHTLYFDDHNIRRWMLDDDHLTLNKKIMDADKDHQDIKSYWRYISLTYANDQTVVKADCPLNELDSLLGAVFSKHFRGVGVEAYYAGKQKSIVDMAREIRHKIENELYEKWKDGDVSIVELLKVSELLIEKVTDIRQHIEDEIAKNGEDIDAIDSDCKANVAEWNNLNIFQKRLFTKGNRIYARHQTDLADLYAARTMTVAWQFAKSLALKLLNEVQKMDADICAFSETIHRAIDQTEWLISEHRKVNKGIEDMRGPIVEVSNEEAVRRFEEELIRNKMEMPVIAAKMRQFILSQSTFYSFSRLADYVSSDDIHDVFDIELSKIVRQKQDEIPISEKRVLGINILSQLQQMLQTDEDIDTFANKLLRENGAFLNLDHNEVNRYVRNNEGDLSPSNPVSINRKCIYVSIPKPQTESQEVFAEKLEQALYRSFVPGIYVTTLSIDMTSPYESELSISTINYLFPMRCIEGLRTYKERYERMQSTEGANDDLPSLFVVENAEEIIRERQSLKPQAPFDPLLPPPPPIA